MPDDSPQTARAFVDAHLMIEHPEWIPVGTKAKLNLRLGDDKGRIYRVYPAGVELRKIPRLDLLIYTPEEFERKRPTDANTLILTFDFLESSDREGGIRAEPRLRDGTFCGVDRLPFRGKSGIVCQRTRDELGFGDSVLGVEKGIRRRRVCRLGAK